MQKNAICQGGKNSEPLFRDFLKGFSLMPPKIASFKSKLSKAIEKLPYEEKIVLSLYHCEEMTIAEIGEILQKKEQDISYLYHNAISNLRSKFHLNV
jgi:hypothetical protein